MDFNLHNSLVTQVNAEKPRSYYIPFKDRNFSLNMKDSSEVTMLTKWRFAYFPKFEEKLIKFTPEKEIEVPSCWQILGYDFNQYTNIRYPFPYNPPYILKDIPCGIYETEYVLEVKKDKYYINFDGVDSCLYLLIDNRFVGYSTVSHSISEFDITDFLHKGVNKIKVIVLKYCQASYLEDQDKLRMSGIFRDVYILNRPEDHITDYKITTDFEDETGFIALDIDKKANIELYDGENLLISRNAKQARFTIPNVKLWSSEEPNLYRLVIEYNGEYIEEFVGIRTVKITGNIFKINNQPIKFKGVNRHSMTINGYVENREDLEKDLQLMKKYNVDTIRTSHYSPHPLLTKLCDIYGFYVIEEADVESHGSCMSSGHWIKEEYCDIATNVLFKEQIIHRQERMYQRDKNRQCVVMWSMGNECGFTFDKRDSNFMFASDYLRKVDNRPIHFESAFALINDYSRSLKATDLFSCMYPGYDFCEYYEKLNLNIPYFLCEYSHAMGNSCGDIQHYVDKFYQYDFTCGGCIWEWCDHGVIEGNKQFYGGDFKENLHDSNFCADGLVSLDRKIVHSSLLEVSEAYSPVYVYFENGKIYFENKKFFTNLSNLTCKCLTKVNGKVINEIEININSIKPGEKRQMDIEIPFNVKGFVTLDFAFENVKIGAKNIKQIIISEYYPLIIPMEAKEIKISNNKIKVGQYVVTLNDKGLISGIKKGKIQYLIKDMRFNICRNFIDNDRNVAYVFKDLFMDREDVNFFAIKNEVKNNSIEITGFITYDSILPYAEVKLAYSFYEDGLINVDIKAIKGKHIPEFTRFGVTLTLSRDYINVRYFGSGPYESYEDKHHLSSIGLYNDQVEDMWNHYVKPQENGSHCFTRMVELSNNKNSLEISSNSNFSFSTSIYNQYTLPAHDYELTDSGEVYLNIDYRMSGVGSNSCGPSMMDKYRILEKEIHFNFNIKAK